MAYKNQIYLKSDDLFELDITDYGHRKLSFFVSTGEEGAVSKFSISQVKRLANALTNWIEKENDKFDRTIRGGMNGLFNSLGNKQAVDFLNYIRKLKSDIELSPDVKRETIVSHVKEVINEE